MALEKGIPFLPPLQNTLLLKGYLLLILSLYPVWNFLVQQENPYHEYKKTTLLDILISLPNPQLS